MDVISLKITFLSRVAHRQGQGEGDGMVWDGDVKLEEHLFAI